MDSPTVTDVGAWAKALLTALGQPVFEIVHYDALYQADGRGSIVVPLGLKKCLVDRRPDQLQRNTFFLPFGDRGIYLGPQKLPFATVRKDASRNFCNVIHHLDGRSNGGGWQECSPPDASPFSSKIKTFDNVENIRHVARLVGEREPLGFRSPRTTYFDC